VNYNIAVKQLKKEEKRGKERKNERENVLKM